eukprot:5465165-Ditylum_brightwellii.AAC.1
MVDDNSDNNKKLSSHHNHNVKAKGSAKGKLPKDLEDSKLPNKFCMLCQQFGGNPNYHSG